MLDLLKFMMGCATFVICLLLVLLALPKSRLRCFLLEIWGWGTAALSTIYILSPIDLIPDFIPFLGLFDDAGALVAAVGSIATAVTARRDRKLLDKPQTNSTGENLTAKKLPVKYG